MIDKRVRTSTVREDPHRCVLEVAVSAVEEAVLDQHVPGWRTYRTEVVTEHVARQRRDDLLQALNTHSAEEKTTVELPAQPAAVTESDSPC